jgi:3-oxoacyl-[acyl-carrier protein] reductase
VFDLTGRVALVTGAGRSVGAKIARTLAECGAAVAVNDLHAERADETVQLIREAKGTAAAVPFDVTDLDAVMAGVTAAEAALGPVDILVNNAGVPEGMEAKAFRDLEPAQWTRQVDLNTYAVMNCCKAVLDGMCERGFGRIVTVSSMAATAGVPGTSAYSAGKGGAIGFTHTLALETAKHGVTCNVLALGIMENMEARGIAPTRPNPVGRFGTGRDVGAAIVWLAAEGDWITGQTIGLNGGAHPS